MKKIYWLSIITFLLDFITKQIVVHFLTEGQSITMIKNFFHFTYAQNTGVAFSMLERNLIFIIVMTLIIITIMLHYIKEATHNQKETICYGMIIGGALGNLIDRICYGYVIDFLDFRIFGYHFPIFNLADCMIVIGVALLIIISIIEESRGKNDNTSRRKSKNR